MLGEWIGLEQDLGGERRVLSWTKRGLSTVWRQQDAERRRSAAAFGWSVTADYELLDSREFGFDQTTAEAVNS